MPLNLLAGLAAIASLIATRPVACDKQVFAHHIIGNTYAYTSTDFSYDIANASAAGIDGFALNIGTDSYTNSSLDAVFEAAESFYEATAINFTLFFSFDYGNVPDWDPSLIIYYLNHYSSSSAYFWYEGKPVASTFEGPSHDSDWTNIKSETGCFFIPDYSSLGAAAAAEDSNVDGLFSWDAWPAYTADVPTSDQSYITALAGKPYMAPISPWFYTNIPSYTKNWLWHTSLLWPLRWQQITSLSTPPTFIELLTWNDWGESHYLAPLLPTALEGDIPSQAQWYADLPHNAWLNDLPYYIAKYKSGAEPAAGSYTPHITFWYRLNPVGACSADGTVCNSADNGQTTYPVADCVTDAVFFNVFSPEAASVSVSVGGVALSVTNGTGSGNFWGQALLGDHTGAVVVEATVTGGSTLGPVTGPAITTDCYDGDVNFNAWVGGS